MIFFASRVNETQFILFKTKTHSPIIYKKLTNLIKMTNINRKDEKMQFSIKHKNKFGHEVILKTFGAYDEVSLKRAFLKDFGKFLAKHF